VSMLAISWLGSVSTSRETALEGGGCIPPGTGLLQHILYVTDEWFSHAQFKLAPAHTALEGGGGGAGLGLDELRVDLLHAALGLPHARRQGQYPELSGTRPSLSCMRRSAFPTLAALGVRAMDLRARWAPCPWTGGVGNTRGARGADGEQSASEPQMEAACC
jgi:hypothetical protein